jgi:4-amino-4-deoxy-L-arabinose transferase-like glycosyltransferase
MIDKQRQNNNIFLKHRGILIILVAALALRALLWQRIPRTGLISDEGEYLAAAHWIAYGRGFSWYMNYLWTRAPLYPLLLAVHLKVFGDTSVPIYFTQTILSLVNVILVYALTPFFLPNADGASQTPAPALIAAALMAVYLPFALYTQVLLTEILYITLLLSGFLLLAFGITNPGKAKAVRYVCISGAGILFGLASITRSFTVGFIPVVVLYLLFGMGNKERKMQTTTVSVMCSFMFVICSALIVLPWSVYNSRLYGGFVLVDTSGAYNLMLGARSAYDGRRTDAPSRDFVRALVDPAVRAPDPKIPIEEARTKLLRGFADGDHIIGYSCLLEREDPRLLAALRRPYSPELNEQLPQAQVQQLMLAEAICLIKAKPLAFVQKSLLEAVDLFQINYSGDERFTDGFTTGRLPIWYTIALFLLDDTLYIVVLPLAVIGFAIRRSQMVDRQFLIILAGLWWCYTVGVAPLLFAINRFRLPLMPFMFIFAAYAMVHFKKPSSYVFGAWRHKLQWLWLVLAAALMVMVLPSYIGTSRSSALYTFLGVSNRQNYLNTVLLREALHNGDVRTAQSLIKADLTREGRLFAPVLLLEIQGQYDDALKQLDQIEADLRQAASDGGRDIPSNDKVEIAVVRGDLLRHKGNTDEALKILGQTLVDQSNPVQWAWDWLHPPETREINIGGTLDLGYVEGCYLGEGSIDEQAHPFNARWCIDGARLRFPSVGTTPQTLVLWADGRGWPSDMLPVPTVSVFVDNTQVGTFTPSHTAVKEFRIALPARTSGGDLVVTLRTPAFIPDASDYLSQQGPLAGMVRRLGIRLDKAQLLNQ